MRFVLKSLKRIRIGLLYFSEDAAMCIFSLVDLRYESYVWSVLALIIQIRQLTAKSLKFSLLM